MGKRSEFPRGAVFQLTGQTGAYAPYQGRKVEVVRHERDVGEVSVRLQGHKGVRYVRPEELKAVRHG